MRLLVLGTAAGGGVPQWNCTCSGCSGARTYPDRQRTHASVAVQFDAENWLVINASPDIAGQIEKNNKLWPGPGPRQTPVGTVVLTDAELDHTLGLLRLREAQSLELVTTAAVRAALTEELRIDRILGAYTQLRWTGLTEQPVRFGDLELSAVPLSDKRPRYAATVPAPGPWVIALRITDRRTGHTLLYAPCVARWTDALESAVNDADCVFLDGTFWDDDEPVRAGISSRSATEMGHLPITETRLRLSKSAAKQRFYTHLNNTNPLVDDGAAEHRKLAGLGIQVAREQAVIEL
jgi:pyrroloquinoline quinone biosynthesis protein B